MLWITKYRKTNKQKNLSNHGHLLAVWGSRVNEITEWPWGSYGKTKGQLGYGISAGQFHDRLNCE